MGQEACKYAWPKPAGGYQTITGRRYGRRHAYVSFRPSFNGQGRDEHQHDEDSERLELENVQNENSSRSSPLGQVSSLLLDEPLLENTGTAEPVCQNAPRQAIEASTSPLSVFCYGLEGKEITENFMNPYENPDDLAEYASGGCNDLNGQSGMAFVSIDAYEPDSSDGEEDDDQDIFSLAREEASVVQEALDNVFSEFQKGLESFTDLQSQLSTLSHHIAGEYFEEAGPNPLMRYFSMDPGLACSNNRSFRSSTEGQDILGSHPNGANYESDLINNTVDVEVGTLRAIINELNVNDRNTDEENSPELVVRCRSRKQNTAEQDEGEKLLPGDEEESSWRRTEIAEVQQGSVECALRSKEEMSSCMFFESRWFEGHQKNQEGDLMRNAVVQEQKNVQGDSSSDKDEDSVETHTQLPCLNCSSECSDGEWPTAVPPYFTAVERDHSSSEESWETVPAREESEPEVQSSSSGVDENTDFCFEGGEQASLEEGEIPWLQYQEAIESSSDEENDPVGDFVYPGFFLLDGNNNLEDDFDVNEDLDVEWRLLDEFDDGLGLAQSVSYVDPQFLPFTALEGPLQFFETALAQLEALGFDIEQANPPATGETIDSLPQIIVTGDHEGEEHCCTICCSEYVKDEIITELPCHHLFHKPCVTLWLQKSGTCPVCRHVLEPVVPEEAAAPFSFLSDNDSSSPVHSATETSN